MPLAEPRSARRGRQIPSLSPVENLAGQFAIYRDQLQFMQKKREVKGDLFRFRFGGFPVLFVNHPDHVNHVLVGNHENYDKDVFFFRAGRVVLRDGLIVNPGGESWSRRRRIMQPAFRQPSVALISKNIVDLTASWLRKWESRLDDNGAVVIEDIGKEAGDLTIRIVAQSLFGVDVEGRTERFIADFLQVNTIFGNFFRCPFPPLSWRRSLRGRIRQLDSFVSDLMNARLHGDAEQRDLFSMLFSAIDEETGQRLTEKQLAVEILNMMLAAYETTALALSWMLYYLANNPDVQRLIQAEVDEVLGRRAPEFADMASLPYTRMVIDETLRLCPPAWMTTRHAIADDEIDGYFVPAGTSLSINIFLMHRHPQFWPEPEVFDPDRFSRAAVAARPRQAYQPFATGPRHCLGKNFALTELHLITAMLSQVFRVARPDGLPPVRFLPLATLHSDAAIQLRLERR